MLRRFSLFAAATLFAFDAHGYVGPGDITSYTAWFGVRGYSAAVAAPGTAPAVRVRRASDNAETDIVILTTGDLDVATAAAFTSVDATGTGDISGTTLTFTGGTIGDVVTGGGTLPGTFIISGTSPTWTVNLPQTVASATLTLTFGLFVTTIYDQTAGGACAGSCNLVQATTTRQPVLLLTSGGSGGALPGIFGRHVGANRSRLDSAGNHTPATGVLSQTVVANRRIGTENIEMFGLINQNRIDAGPAANQWTLTAGGGLVTATATDEAWHAANGVINGASSVINIDGTETTGTATGSTSADLLRSYQSAGSVANVYVMLGEAGLKDNVVWSAGTRTDLCANQRAYWGITGSCVAAASGAIIPRAPLTHW